MLGYLGPKGTFSHLAAQKFGKENETLLEYSTIYSLLRAVNIGEIERAIVPIENSIEGSVNITLDTLAFDVDLYITQEFVLNINQNLLVKKGTKKEDITEIASIDQAIGQCSHILNDEFEHVKITYTDSTAKAAEMVYMSDGHIGGIGSKNSAELFGLDILIKNCNDENNNSTRFVVVEKTPNKNVTDHDRTSIAFVVPNTPGSLYKAIYLFSEYNINMIKIESRPIKKELGEYVFFIDIDGNIDNPEIYFALDKLKSKTDFYKFLGSYERNII